MKQNVIRKTLTGSWTAFNVGKKGRVFNVKNLSNDYILVSFEENDPHEWQCFKIAAGQTEKVAISFDLFDRKEYKANTIYVKGTGEVEVQSVDTYAEVMPRLALAVEPVTGDVDLLGKVAADLQEDIEVDVENSKITGTSIFVYDYTGFSGDPSEQKGNYLALKATANYDVPITAELIGGTHGAVTLDDDGILVARITSNSQSIRFSVQTEDETVTYDFALTDLILVEPLTLTVSAVAGDQVLLGKQVSDLQTDIVIGEDEITGTSKYVTDYTGFSGDPEEQEGNYLALHIVANYDAIITAQLIGGTHGAVTLDDDGLLVVRITSNEQSLRFVATYNGITETVDLRLNHLSLLTTLLPFEIGDDLSGGKTIYVNKVQNIESILRESGYAAIYPADSLSPKINAGHSGDNYKLQYFDGYSSFDIYSTANGWSSAIADDGAYIIPNSYKLIVGRIGSTAYYNGTVIGKKA